MFTVWFEQDQIHDFYLATDWNITLMSTDREILDSFLPSKSMSESLGQASKGGFLAGNFFIDGISVLDKSSGIVWAPQFNKKQFVKIWNFPCLFLLVSFYSWFLSLDLLFSSYFFPINFLENLKIHFYGD